MILICGSKHDDVLYYLSILKFPKEVSFLKDGHATVGTIFNREVMIYEGLYTSYLSSSMLMYLSEKYFVDLVFLVGKCEGISDNLALGDIAVSSTAIFGDLDQVKQVKGTALGQIPGIPKQFNVNVQLLTTLNRCLDCLTTVKHYDCCYFSSPIYGRRHHLMSEIINDDDVLKKRNNLVLDGETAGIALTSFLLDIPFISVKVVAQKAGDDLPLEQYLQILKQYASIGRAVVSCIGELSRPDVVR